MNKSSQAKLADGIVLLAKARRIVLRVQDAELKIRDRLHDGPANDPAIRSSEEAMNQMQDAIGKIEKAEHILEGIE